MMKPVLLVVGIAAWTQLGCDDSPRSRPISEIPPPPPLREQAPPTREQAPPSPEQVRPSRDIVPLGHGLPNLATAPRDPRPPIRLGRVEHGRVEYKQFAFSPDSARIVSIRSGKLSALVSHRSDGSDEQILAWSSSTATIVSFWISPDSQTVVYKTCLPRGSWCSSSRQDYRLIAVPIAGGARTPLMSWTRPLYALFIDARRFLVGVGEDVFLASLDAPAEPRLLVSGPGVHLYGVTPDGEQLVYRRPVGQLRSIRLDGTDDRLVRDGIDPDSRSVQVDNGVIVWSYPDCVVSLVPFDGSDPVLLTLEPLCQPLGSFALAGDRRTFTAIDRRLEVSGWGSIRFRWIDLVTGERRSSEVPIDMQTELFPTELTPGHGDTVWYILSRRTPGRVELRVTGAGIGTDRAVALNPEPPILPTPDGRGVVVATRVTDAARKAMVYLDLRTGDVHRLGPPDHPGVGFVISPDSRHLLYAGREHNEWQLYTAALP